MLEYIRQNYFGIERLTNRHTQDDILLQALEGKKGQNEKEDLALSIHEYTCASKRSFGSVAFQKCI